MSTHRDAAADAVEWVATSVGLAYDAETSVGRKALEMVQVQEVFMAEPTMMAGSAVLGTIALLLAGRVLFGRTQTTSTKAACLCISFIWAGQAIKFLETTCGIDSTRVAAGSEQKPWPAQGFLSALCYGLVSGVLTVLGQSGFLLMHRPFRSLTASPSQQIGLVLIGWSMLSPLGYVITGGGVPRLSFPVDAFTAGFFLSAVEDSGYSQMVLGCALAVTSMRAAVGVHAYQAPADIVLLVVCFVAWQICSRWGRKRNAYEWPQPKVHESENPRPVKTRRSPLFQETPNGNGGVQGLKFVKENLKVDEDGDEADEFFEVTDEGLRQRNPTR